MLIHLFLTNRYPFESQEQYIPIRKTILKLSIELASTAQRDQFVEKPNDVIESSCINLAELCDRIVQELNDSLAIQPAVLDIVTVKKKPEEDLGMHIHSSYYGIHVVGGIKFQSPSHRCGRIEEGDEIVQVGYQTVVGWQLKKLVNCMKEYPTEIILTIKKRPRHSNFLGQVIVLKPYKIPNRKAGRQNSRRMKNAATTTTGSDSDDDAFLPNYNSSDSKPVYQLYPSKSKLPVRRRATSVEANEIIAARNRCQLLSDSSNTRYAKIVFTQNPKGSFSPQIPPRRLRVQSIQTPESASLERQQIISQKENEKTSETKTFSSVSSNTDNNYKNFSEKVEETAPPTPRQIQPPRPLPRKSINKRETVLPGFVQKMTNSYDQMGSPIESRIPSVPNTPPIRRAYPGTPPIRRAMIPNTPPTRPAVPKPNHKFNGLPKIEPKGEQNGDDNYEYVFRPTMAMIKTGIVNPLYERVPNKTWSAGTRINSTGKGRMPSPNEFKQLSVPQQNDSEESNPQKNESKQSPNESLSFLDREYNRLYGVKKPKERLSPKIPPFVPKSASSAEIENIYTSKPRTTSSSSIGHFDDTSSPPMRSFGSTRERPHTPYSSDNSMSSSSGISSYYSEIHAEQMQRIRNIKRQTSSSSFNSAKSSPPHSHSSNAFDFSDRSIEQLKTPPNESYEENGDNSSKSTKSPQKSSSFRSFVFSSPKLLKKLSTPKYHKERHLEKRDVNNRLIP